MKPAKSCEVCLGSGEVLPTRAPWDRVMPGACEACGGAGYHGSVPLRSKAPLLAEWDAAVPDELLSQAAIDSARASLKSRLAALQLQLDHAVARGVQ